MIDENSNLSLYMLYKQASEHRDILMMQNEQLFFESVQCRKERNEAQELLVKALSGTCHWKRSALRYLKRSAPEMYKRLKG